MSVLEEHEGFKALTGEEQMLLKKINEEINSYAIEIVRMEAQIKYIHNVHVANRYATAERLLQKGMLKAQEEKEKALKRLKEKKDVKADAKK